MMAAGRYSIMENIGLFVMKKSAKPIRPGKKDNTERRVERHVDKMDKNGLAWMRMHIMQKQRQKQIH